MDKFDMARDKMIADHGKKAAPKKVEKVMHEYKAGELHSGSSAGPLIKSKKQALAVALAEGRKAKK